jgi:hypothetical protein
MPAITGVEEAAGLLASLGAGGLAEVSAEGVGVL